MEFVGRFVIFLALAIQTGEGAHIGSWSSRSLYLTEFINSGRIAEARKLSKNPVGSRYPNGEKESYSGYLTVNGSTDTNLFMWFFPSETTPENAPLLLWLQGGPGSSSMYGAFLENGPYELESDFTLKSREHYWSQKFNVLYIDNPPGTGFSFTKEDYAKDEDDVGRTLHEATRQFFELFPELRSNEFYVTGESYAGKYVPALAHYIHKTNPSMEISRKINLKGIAIGNGIIDPISQVNNSQYLYQLGMIDQLTFTSYNGVADKLEGFIAAEEWSNATTAYFELWDLVLNATNFELLFNILSEKSDLIGKMQKVNNYLNMPVNKASLHVGSRFFQKCKSAVSSNLFEDRMKSVENWFVEVAENYDVLLYTGQLDMIRPYTSVVEFINQIEWSGRDAYGKAPRQIWREGDDVAGYWKTVDRKNSAGVNISFSEVLVRNAGHLVPADQPLWTMQMLTKFTNVNR
uniref:Carboxypeptidase n=3 Tax=Lygus hesperus TaxID=30085 RepID=A0A0A9YF08_LYGHE